MRAARLDLTVRDVPLDSPRCRANYRGNDTTCSMGGGLTSRSASASTDGRQAGWRAPAIVCAALWSEEVAGRALRKCRSSRTGSA